MALRREDCQIRHLSKKDDSTDEDMVTNSNHKLATILKGLADSTSVHGIPKIVSSRQLAIKILWCLLFMGACALFLLQLFSLFKTYYAHPIKTTVSLSFSSLRFPAVTFCNMNPIKRSKLDMAPTLKAVINPKVKTISRGSGARKKREVTTTSSSVQPTATATASATATAAATATTTTVPIVSPTTSDTIVASPTVVASPASSTVNPTTASLAISPTAAYQSTTEGSGSATSTTDYDYSYDYWNQWWWDYPTESSTSENYNWTAGFSNYDFDYSTNAYWSDYGDYGSGTYDQNYGYERYLFDQFNSPKDIWDEMVVNFQAHFKNETTESRGKIGHMVGDMVHSASFARSLQNASKFERTTSTEFGNCYTMTSPKYVAWRSGPSYGIKLTLNLEVDEYIKNFASGYGIRMVFHEPGTFPLPAEEGLTLSPGFETSIGLRLVHITRLSEPHGECSDGKDFLEKYKIRYSISACLQFCRAKATIDTCKCSPSDGPDVVDRLQTEKTRICNNSATIDKICLLQVDGKFDAGESNGCGCISPCSETVYEKTMSGRRWPNDDYLENVLMGEVCRKNLTSMETACGQIKNKTFDAQYYRYNFLRVLIYFEDLNYESITQEPLYEGVRFLSDIGGAMGLFMGASLLSFVEILQLMLEVGLFFWKRQNNVGTNTVDKFNPERKDSFLSAPIRQANFSETPKGGIHATDPRNAAF